MDSLESLGPEPKRARVEIIPLIDVIFFLLATFVLFTLSLQKLHVLDPDVPGADGQGKIDEGTLYLQVSDDACYWRKGSAAPETISAAELRPRLEDFARSEREPRVFIRSDRRAKFGDAVRVLDEVRRAGIRKVAVETMTSPTGS